MPVKWMFGDWHENCYINYKNFFKRGFLKKLLLFFNVSMEQIGFPYKIKIWRWIKWLLSLFELLSAVFFSQRPLLNKIGNLS
jgi:hypothetical protein